MVDQKKNAPQKGEFIDLDKSDFKKKTSFFQITLKYLIIFLIFFSLVFFAYKPLKENLFYKFNEINKIKEKTVEEIGQETLKNEYLLELETIKNIFSDKLNFMKKE